MVEIKQIMRSFLVVTVILGLVLGSLAFKLGDNDDHDHEHEHEHDHNNVEHHANEEIREGKAEALSSGLITNFIGTENSGVSVDFSRCD